MRYEDITSAKTYDLWDKLFSAELQKFVEKLDIPHAMKEDIVRQKQIPLDSIEALPNGSAILLSMCRKSRNYLLPNGMLNQTHKFLHSESICKPGLMRLWLEDNTPEEVIAQCSFRDCAFCDAGCRTRSEFRRQLIFVALSNGEILKMWRSYLENLDIFFFRHSLTSSTNIQCTLFSKRSCTRLSYRPS